MREDSSLKKPLFSLCIPVLNESENLGNLYGKLIDLSQRMSEKCDFEFIFTDNNSTDETWTKIGLLAKQDGRVKGFRFSKNIGFQNSILFNYSKSCGDVVAQIDADLQDPPELLEVFFDEWKKGAQVVYGIRDVRPEPWVLRGFRKIGYAVIDKFANFPIPHNVGDFRLLDRKIINSMQNIKTPEPYIRGIIASLGVPAVGISYERKARVKGKSKFGVISLIRLGLNALNNHTNLAFKFSTFIGLFSLVLSLIGAVYYILMRIFKPDFPPGFASIYVLILFGISINALILSVIGNYVKKIYTILNGEPEVLVVSSV